MGTFRSASEDGIQPIAEFAALFAADVPGALCARLPRAPARAAARAAWPLGTIRQRLAVLGRPSAVLINLGGCPDYSRFTRFG